MQPLITHDSPAQVEADLLVVPITRAEVEAGAAAALGTLDAALGQDLLAIAREDRFEGKLGQTLLFRGLPGLGTRRVLLVGCGGEAEIAGGRLRRVGGCAAKVGRELRAHQVALTLPGALPEGVDPARAAHQLFEGFCYGSYVFDRYVTTTDDRYDGCHAFTLVTDAASSVDVAALERARVLATAVATARNLVNEPPAVLTPNELALRAKNIATSSGLEHTILDETALEAGQFNLILAVGQGSGNAPRLIHLVYRAPDVRAGAEPAHRIAFVGKGVTFDTGGYDLKTGGSMLYMHSDMAGGAAVLGAAEAIGALEPAGVEVHFIVPAVENAVSEKAYKPGDIIRGYGRKSVEIHNTDAEGRLVLADALAYAQEQGVETIVDLATLTGAIVVALGDYTAGLYSSSDALAERLLDAARTAGEDVWRMPLTARIDAQLDSPVADMKNLGRREGGSISAALFLKRWVELDAWAHLDIAGPAFMMAPDDELGQGATGFGVTTLVEYVMGLER